MDLEGREGDVTSPWLNWSSHSNDRDFWHTAMKTLLNAKTANVWICFKYKKVYLLKFQSRLV